MYSKESIVNMIGTHKMKCNVLADVIPEYDSNSIAQYGIQATLPKPQGENSSKVEDVVVRLERANKRYAQMFFSSRRRHTRCSVVSWARRCV
ncbi:hypothetical protein JMUB7519_27950 [Staphylococcus aureus]